MAEEKRVEAVESSPGFVEKATKNKWMMIGIGACVAILVIAVVTKPSDKTGYEQSKVQEPVTALLPGDARQSDWIANAQVELRQTQAMLKDLSKENKELKDALHNNDQTLKTEREQTQRALSELQTFRTQLEHQQARAPTPAANTPPVPPASLPASPKLPEGVVPPPRPGDVLADGAVKLQPLPGSGRADGGSSGARQPFIVQGDDIPADSNTASAQTPDGKVAGRDFLVDQQVKRNPYRGYLPAGSFADVALLSGADVGTAEFTRANPQPFLMRVQSDAITAGAGRYGLRTCFAMGEGFGELSSERAFVRVTKLVCMDKEHGLVLEEAIKGYVVDSDASQGLRGEVVRRNGQLIAKALLAGFAQGIAEVGRATSQANAQMITTPLQQAGSGLVTSSTSIDPGTLAQAGAFGGASNAANQLAQLYIQEAKSIFPVIRVPAGRKGTLIIQEGKALEWKSFQGLYTVETVPQKQTRK